MNDGSTARRRLDVRDRLRRALRGAVDGALATLPMTMVMLGAQRLRLMGTLPPTMITEAARQATVDGTHGAPRALARDAPTRVLTAVSHVAFGAGAGALYGGLAPRARGARWVGAGVVFGLGVWLASYQGWVPLAGILPPATRDRPGRAGTMIVAHVVYGGVLGLLTARR